MPIGLALGTAAITAGTGYLASKSQSKAVKDASQLTQADNAANRAFLTDIYNRNVGNLSPWMQSGQTANSAFMELLGFPAAQPQPAAFGAASPQAAPSAFGGYPFAANDPNMGALSYENALVPDYSIGMTARNAMGQRNLDLARGGMGVPGYGGGTFGPQPMAPPPGGVTVPQPSARSAFDTYRGSTGYDFRFNEGIRALQAGFSRNLESGAAVKSAMRFGQGIGSDEFSRYMDLLRGQSQLGFGAGSALAGVGQNFGNTVTANNQAAATAAANARLYQGNLSAQNWANIGSSFGNALGYLIK